MKSPERLQQMEELFNAALELEPGERAAFLAEACAADADLLRQVQALLSAHEDSGSFMKSPAFEADGPRLAESSPQFEMGRTLGHYRIVTLLGRGGMGEVYLAQDTKLHRRVALKLLRSSLTRDKQRVKRFEQEACAASALNHPNILTVHDLGQADEFNFIATEYVEGETLRQLLKRGKVTLRQATELAIQVAAALTAAHAAGIVHRDIKPENIMLRPDGLVKVLDFGLAKLAEPLDPQAKASSLLRIETDPGMVMGTVNYMSPEQARGVTVDARSDCFSLGVVLYETLTGRVPFEGETASDVIVSILEKEPPPLAWYWPEMPAELQRIVSKALRKDREERYQTVKDLLLDLKTLKHNLEFEAKLEHELTPEISQEVIAARRSGQSLAALAKRQSRASGQIAQAEQAHTGELLHLLKRHRWGAGLTLAVVLFSAMAVAYYSTRTTGVASGAPPLPVKVAAQSAHWWTFDETSGDALDSGTSANPIKAVLGAGVKRVPGRFADACDSAGSAVELQDKDNSFVNFGTGVGQFGKRDFTVSLWFKTSYAVPNRFLEMLSNRPVGTHGNYFSLRFVNSLSPPGRIDFALMQGVTPAVNGINVLSVLSRKRTHLYDGQWHHLVVLRQGTSGKLFVDGILDGQAETKHDGADIREGDGVTDISNGSPLLLGHSPYASQSSNPMIAHGMTFDDVRIFDRALSDEEVAELFGRMIVIIGTCNSNVENRALPSGCTINDRLSICGQMATNQSAFVNCITRLTAELMATQTITKQEKERIDQCAEAAKLP
jgi:serine/threonine protein kinase